MNSRINFAIFICLMLAITGYAQVRNGLPPPPSVAKPKLKSFERQFETFKKLGFELNPGIDFKELDSPEDRVLVEKEPYAMMYMMLGGTIQREPWTPLTNRCWDFDTEAIEDHGAYVEILKNLERISRGAIKFESLQDFVDIEKEIAWVSFSFKGKMYKWNLKVEDDWVDTSLFTRIVSLTKTHKLSGRFTYFDTGGQNAVIGFETPSDLEKIKQATGLKIVWLN